MVKLQMVNINTLMIVQRFSVLLKSGINKIWSFVFVDQGAARLNTNKAIANKLEKFE